MITNYILFSIFTLTACKNLNIVSRTRTSFLEKYESYSDVIMLHLTIPHDTLFASFKFTADETQMSIFSCSTRNVSLYMKHGAPPVINPDGSPFPKNFKNVTRDELYNSEFQTDKKEVYINITSPEPGSYYSVTFLSYTDPRYNAITQQGLSPTCYASVEAMLSVEEIDTPIIVSENDLIEVISLTNENRYFKFYVQGLNDYGIMKVEDIYFADNVQNLVIRIDVNKPPSSGVSQKEEIIYPNTTSDTISYWVQPDSWHYIEIKFQNETFENKEGMSNLTFKLRYFSTRLLNASSHYTFLENNALFNNSISKAYYNNKITDVIPYKQYNLVRESSTETFVFSFELEEELNSNVAIPVNMTDRHFSLFKFKIREGSNSGGTLQFIMAFKPIVKKSKSKITFENQPEEYVLIACIRKGRIEVPTWPNNCVSDDGISKPSQLILNNTVENSTILIPFPESGTWYATFRLFCGNCEPCNCSDECQKQYEECTSYCESNCINSGDCSQCSEECRNIVIEGESCLGCNCDGPCMRNENVTCNSSVLFDIASHPCITGECSENGRCMFMVSDGVVFSTCVCSNKYRGWDCSDGSLATPYYMVVIELLLLVLSNLMFLPAVYIAFKRKYYVESITYLSICFFSTFYHACDAGENIISFCLVRLSALQFGDFFCALLAIWATLIALADISPLLTSICHMIGAIILAFCTTIDRTALWIFALPTITGGIIVIINWYFKYRKVGQRFAKKRYLYFNVPVGGAITAVGLIMYAFLQTENNYKYLHSLWHMIMATAIIIVLPKPNTFLPEVLL